MRLRKSQIASTLIVASFIASGLDAYQFFNIPSTWYSYLIALIAMLFLPQRLSNHRAITFYLLFFAWAMTTTCVALVNLTSSLTLQDLMFILIRFLKLFFFISTLFIYFNFFNSREDIIPFISAVIYIGAIFAAIALYIYVAQVAGLPEFERNRMGTGGDLVASKPIFTYPFHRLLGTFREPGLYVEWILLPYFLSVQFIWRSRIIALCSGLMLGSIFLTGSLLGIVIVASTGGLAILSWTIDSRKIVNYRYFASIFIALSIFSVLVDGQKDTHGYRIADTSHMHAGQLVMLIIEDRVKPLAQSGMQAENRAYLSKAIDFYTVNLTGIGLGISNLQLANALKSKLPGSFLSLYTNALVSTGIIGIFLLSVSLVFPLLEKKIGETAKILYLKDSAIWLLCLYVAYFLTFYATIEELSYGFAITTALILQIAHIITDRASLRSMKSRSLTSCK
ncbi:hypothetical protein [Hydrogenophaga sp. Root209]|uniref:hypothetical protein n=1 Tax=Hydrogenophaga sp. Root209 TaxID=1736490 RepID=UPI000A9FEEFA|nr:hypothetical protein [Hydrogenophaga sp. Root209]